MDNEPLITSDEIAQASTTGDAAAASSAQHTQTTDTADASTRETPVKTETEVARIPLPDHERIIDGFHRRLDSLAWANGLSREEVEEALVLRRQTLADRSKKAEPTAPQPDAKDERGEAFYSPQQASKLAAHEVKVALAAFKQELEDRFGPIEEAFTSVRQRNEALSNQLEEARTWPDFDKHMEAATAHLSKARTAGAPITLHEAYTRAREDAVRASLEPEVKKKLLEQMNDTNTQAKHDINPNRTHVASRKTFDEMDDNELMEHLTKQTA